jgi:hypothetical protein
MEIKEWYLTKFPNDEMGKNISNTATFEGLFEVLDGYEDAYNYLGDIDSLVRERVFAKLSQVMGVSYNEIYDQWLMASESIKSNKSLKNLTEGVINFSYSKEYKGKQLPTFAYIVDVPNVEEDEMDQAWEDEAFWSKDSYRRAEDIVEEMNDDVINFVSKIAYNLAEEYENAYWLEDFITHYDSQAGGPIKLVPGYYEGYTIILEFDDFTIDGMPEDVEKVAKDRIVDFAIMKAQLVANELGLAKVKSGGWTGPIIVKEASTSDIPDFKASEVYETNGIQISVSTKGNEVSKQAVEGAVANLIKTNELDSDMVDYITIFAGYIYIKSKDEKQIKSGYYQIAMAASMAMRPDGATDRQFNKYKLVPIKENAHYMQPQKSIMQKNSNLKEGLSSSLVMLQGKIDEEFELHNYPYVTSEYKNKAFSIAKEKIKQELNLFPTMLGSDLAYKNIDKSQLMAINDIIQDVVEDITLDMGKKKTPQKRYTKGRGGFAGTAKKTSPGRF